MAREKPGPVTSKEAENERGQTAIEYVLVAVFIAIVLVFIFKSGGIESGISGSGSKVASAFPK